MTTHEQVQRLIQETVKAGGTPSEAVEMAKLLVLMDIRDLLLPIADWMKR